MGARVSLDAAVFSRDEGDEFGSSVAISGDTIVVGAPGTDDGAGAAYVFVRSA